MKNVVRNTLGAALGVLLVSSTAFASFSALSSGSARLPIPSRKVSEASQVPTTKMTSMTQAPMTRLPLNTGAIIQRPEA